MTAPQIAAAEAVQDRAAAFDAKLAEFEAQLTADLAACLARIAEIEAGIAADRARPHLTVVAS